MNEKIVKSTLQSSVLLIVLVFISFCFAAPSFAVSNENLRKWYRKDVPQAYRNLVTFKDYRRTIFKLFDIVHYDNGERLYRKNKKRARRIAASPCYNSISTMMDGFYNDSDVRASISRMYYGLQRIPMKGTTATQANPWGPPDSGGELWHPELMVIQMERYFDYWCTFLPRINGTKDNALDLIQGFAWIYYHNVDGQLWVQGKDDYDPTQSGLAFTKGFSSERGAFLDDPASMEFVPEWIADPRIEISDYEIQDPEGYHFYNDFFTRHLRKNPYDHTLIDRPVTFPDRDYVVVAPTDCIMNPLVQVLQPTTPGHPERTYINNPLDLNTVIDVKNVPISINRLLGDTPNWLKVKFEKGTGISCVLMPNTYHHFHSPVDGEVVYVMQPSDDGTFGSIDFANWVPDDGNVARPGADFSQFENYQRAAVIIEVSYSGASGEPLIGYVATIPVGLESVGSVVLDSEFENWEEGDNLSLVKGVTRIGHFEYGGSLDIMLFSKDLSNAAIQTRLGNQITLFEAGTKEGIEPVIPWFNPPVPTME